MDTLFGKKITNVSAISEKKLKTIGMVWFYSLTDINIPAFRVVPKYVVFGQIRMNKVAFVVLKNKTKIKSGKENFLIGTKIFLPRLS